MRRSAVFWSAVARGSRAKAKGLRLKAKGLDRPMPRQSHSISVASFLCGGDEVTNRISGQTAASPFAPAAPELCCGTPQHGAGCDSTSSAHEFNARNLRSGRSLLPASPYRRFAVSPIRASAFLAAVLQVGPLKLGAVTLSLGLRISLGFRAFGIRLSPPPPYPRRTMAANVTHNLHAPLARHG